MTELTVHYRSEANIQNTLKGSSLVGGNSVRGRVENDFYATPKESTMALLEREEFKGYTLEPCCGAGHISEVLKSKGLAVLSNDLIDRGYPSTRKDFLKEDFDNVENVITNPPFKYAKEFIEKSLSITNSKVAMFCKIQLLEGVTRKRLLENTPLKSVYVFSKRQNPLRNGSPVDENGKKWSSTMCFAWFVWEHGYTGEPIIRWI